MALQTANQYGLGIDGVGLSNRLLKIMQANKVDAATAQTAKAEALQQQLKTTGAQLLHIRNNIEGKEAQKKAIANLATEKINQGQDSGIYDELLNIDDPDLLNTRMTQIIIRATDADKQLEKGMGINGGESPTAAMKNYAKRDALVKAGASKEDLARFDNYVRAQKIIKNEGVQTIVGAGGETTELGTVPGEAEASATIAGAAAGAEEEAVLSAQAGEGDAPSRAEIAGAVTAAQEQEKLIVKRSEEERLNKQAWNAYNAGMQNLAEALGDTITGPLVGWSPAVTSAQQIAKGAEAVMAPLLKQLFRGAGEGTFTDRDQALLLEMLPTRRDHPEASAAKVKMINQIVAAKLGSDFVIPESSGELTDEQKARLEELRNKQQ